MRILTLEQIDDVKIINDICSYAKGQITNKAMIQFDTAAILTIAQVWFIIYLYINIHFALKVVKSYEKAIDEYDDENAVLKSQIADLENQLHQRHEPFIDLMGLIFFVFFLYYLWIGYFY